MLLPAHSQNKQAKLSDQLHKLDAELKDERDHFNGKLRDVSILFIISSMFNLSSWVSEYSKIVLIVKPLNRN